jgi:hypothetical protein
MIQSPLYTVHYSDEQHDQIITETDSLFEATCEMYNILPILEDYEWATIYDSNDEMIAGIE